MKKRSTSANAHVRRLRNLGAKLEWLPKGRRIDISATEIRERAAKELPIDHLTPAAVAKMIARKKIYHTPKKRVKRKLA